MTRAHLPSEKKQARYESIDSEDSMDDSSDDDSQVELSQNERLQSSSGFNDEVFGTHGTIRRDTENYYRNLQLVCQEFQQSDGQKQLSSESS